MATKIEWTDVTDNIIVVKGGGWWCRRISPGCDHCYAEKLNQNTFFGGNKMPYRGAPPVLKLKEEIVDGWARQRKPKKHFVASMTDIFGEWVSQEMIFRFLDGMADAPLQTFQLLTKRPENAVEQICAWLNSRDLRQLPANIWIGVTVENQEWADKRRAWFEMIPAQTKFISYEPALGLVDWSGWEFIDQIISGGESGTSARPSYPDWHRATRDWCVANGKAYFFKQWGEFAPTSEYRDGQIFMSRVGKKDAGRKLDGREWNESPTAAGAVVPATVMI